jgi:hypothetical protein
VIDGVQVVALRQIPDERGTVMHMLKRTDPHFAGFGEIYFTTVHPGVVKGWHKHGRMTLNYACPYNRKISGIQFRSTLIYSKHRVIFLHPKILQRLRCYI